MKKIQIKYFLPLIAVLQFSACTQHHHKQDYLSAVSQKLERIKSVSYYETVNASAPYDTVKFFPPRTNFYRVFANPKDSLIEAASATYEAGDTTHLVEFYDGQVRGKCYWDKQYVKVDSFQNNPYPFRLVYYPFYTQINAIISYALTTRDSIDTRLIDQRDSVHFVLKIFNKQVYFHIKPFVNKNQYVPKDEVSQFDIWIRKSDSLPYRMRSRWSHQTFFRTVTNPHFNFTKDTVFRAGDYYPSSFNKVVFARGKDGKPKLTLVGKQAPDWVLMDADSNRVALKDFKSKVLLLKFTGIGCGPCHQSIPFMKKLVSMFPAKDFELVSIETWSHNLKGIRRYQRLNRMNYRFLMATNEVKDAYQVQGVPLFLILDKDRIIRKEILGYSEGTTDQQILKSIQKLIQ